MTSRSLTGVAAFAAAAALTLPAVASAAPSVYAGPIKAKGYDVSLSGSGTSLSVMATKTKGGSTQTHMWSFQNAKITATSIKASLGKYGKVNLKLKGAKKAKGTVPKGCKGTPGTTKTGTFTGSASLKLDSGFFKTVKSKKMKGLVADGGKLDCSGVPTDDAKGMVLSASQQLDAGGSLMLSISKTGSDVQQLVMVSPDAAATAPASVSHMIMAKAGAAGLDAAGDMSTATAAAAGPFLSGKLTFTGEPMGTMAAGTLSGDFAAKFDSIGTQSLPAGTDAMLMQR